MTFWECFYLIAGVFGTIVMIVFTGLAESYLVPPADRSLRKLFAYATAVTADQRQRRLTRIARLRGKPDRQIMLSIDIKWLRCRAAFFYLASLIFMSCFLTLGLYFVESGDLGGYYSKVRVLQMLGALTTIFGAYSSIKANSKAYELTIATQQDELTD